MTTQMVVHGGHVTIDVEDVAKFNKKEWFIDPIGRVVSKGPNMVYLHRYLLDYNGPLCVDHIDHDVKNNSKSNLRIVTKSENSLNRRNKSTFQDEVRYPGVSKRKTGYIAYVCVKRKLDYIGIYKTVEEAVKAREL